MCLKSQDMLVKKMSEVHKYEKHRQQVFARPKNEWEKEKIYLTHSQGHVSKKIQSK
jgi:hypothetical protein